jgi:hypothetical protein
MSLAVDRVSQQGIALIFAVALSVAGGYAEAQQRQRPLNPPSNQTQQQQAAPDNRGTEQVPFVVKETPRERSAEERKETQEKSELDRKLTGYTSDLATYTQLLFVATVLLAILTGALAIAAFSQIREGRRSIKAAEDAAKAAAASATHLESSTAQAARSADAMEDVAEAMTANVTNTRQLIDRQREYAQMQMRAYLSVIIGAAIYQESGKDIRFEAKPIVVNTGHTPAQNVMMNLRAEILPVPFPAGFTFPLLTQAQGGAEIGPRQDRLLSAIVDGFVLDPDTPRIMRGQGHTLTVWGTITYTDVFGDPHTTKFGQILTWLPNGQIFGLYTAEHNNSD